jgi:exopolysaccharide biosynthesis polyprenyl glycosylphosphotransferase
MESSTATPAGSSRETRAGHPSVTTANGVDASRARRRGAVLARALCWGDGIAAFVAAAVAVLILGIGPLTSEGTSYILSTTLLWPLAAFAVGLYRGDQLANWTSAVAEVPRAVVSILVIAWPLFGVSSLLEIPQPVALTAVTVAALGATAAIARTIVRAALHRVPDLRQRTLILGSGVVAGQVAKKLQNNNQFGLVPIGLVDDEVYDVGAPDLPWLGKFDDLDRIIEEKGVDRVIIAFSRASHEELLKSIRACRDAGIAIDVVPRLFEFLDGVSALDQVGGLPLLSIGVADLSSVSMAAKRTLDIIGSAAALLVLSPILIATAIAIKIESRGPVLFRQPRAGRYNTSFQLIKFRSMYVDAEQRKQDLAEQNEAKDGVMFKIREDPRVTRVGRVLRRFSLDELPQLINVLKGEMSLVGPRPLIFPETAALEKHWHLRRLELRPGLTGPWQVYGRSQSPFQEMVRFDYQYVAGWSLARDIELLLATLPAVLSGRGAY